MEHYRLVAIDDKPLPQHLRLLDDPHTVLGGEMELTSEEVRFVVRLLPERRRATITLLEPYRRLPNGEVEFPTEPHMPVEFRAAWKGDQFVLVAKMGSPHHGTSLAESLGGNHSWHFAREADGEFKARSTHAGGTVDAGQ